jgi:uncharacterized protein
MQITSEIQGSDGSFYANDNGEQVGEIRFAAAGNDLEIYHTHVSQARQGQHIGENLVQAVADYARQEGKKIIPSCTFAKTVFARNAGLKDVLA